MLAHHKAIFCHMLQIFGSHNTYGCGFRLVVVFDKLPLHAEITTVQID